MSAPPEEGGKEVRNRRSVTKKRGSQRAMVQDQRLRVMPVYSRGNEWVILVNGYSDAALVGRYMAAVGVFLDTNDPRHLAPFKGQGVRDIRGRSHPFETRPNQLYRLTEGGPTPFEQIYKILV